MKDFYACVMAGGSGERFWPLSRSTKPKHLLRLFSDQTLLEQTIGRLDGLIPPKNIIVLTNEVQITGVREVLPDFEPNQFVAEPAKRDTAPAAALATALVARQGGDDALMALLPADALIQNVEAFQCQLKDAAALAAETGALVTVTIKPTYPATGFGYLELGKDLGKSQFGSRKIEVKRFVEKPAAATAQQYVKSGQYGWNAGIFVWRVGNFRKELARLQPELADFVQDFVQSSNSEELLKEKFPKLPKISVDYAVMEKAQKVAAVESQFDWDDVGSWTALPAHLGEDKEKNCLQGEVAVHDSRNNIVMSEGRVIALCGVKDLVVVETADAVLVCHRDAVQDVKKLQSLLPPEVVK